MPSTIDGAPYSEIAITQMLASARAAAHIWAATPINTRLSHLRRLTDKLVQHADQLIAACSYLPQRRAGETLAAEIIPLADAARYLVRNAARILEPAAHRSWGLRIITERRPLGCILIVGPSNYPLFLPGVQLLQALAAGNAVILKPGSGGAAVAMLLQKLLVSTCIPDGLVHITSDSTQWVGQIIAAGIDKVVVTGSQKTGQVVAKLIGQSRPTDSVMELSGADAAIVLPGADVDRAAAAIAFGLSFNAGATCMLPRRIYVARTMADALLAKLRQKLESVPPINLDAAEFVGIKALVNTAMQNGATILCGQLNSDGCTGPLVLGGVSGLGELPHTDQLGSVSIWERYDQMDDLLAAYHASSMRLGASVFGPEAAALSIARRLDAGCICINDLLAPTGHPAVSLSPRKDSGYGSTRGAEGLLEMTSPVTVVCRVGRFLPHLSRENINDDQTLKDILKLKHAADAKLRVESLLRIIRRGRKPAAK
jgi:acyl-CoA reductase-like NAD-dependent aldehyde dehydrogenase